MSEVKVNKISPRTACGTVTLGDSGDTFTIPSGATITNSGTASGFGATGETSWDTTVKTTGTFTATAGVGYFLNTTGGIITVNLPVGAAGSSVAMADYAATWQTNNVTVTPNGSEKIGGSASSATLSTQGQSVTFVYIDSTQGWVNVIDSTSNVRGAAFVTATGGTPCSGAIVCTNYKVHTFTGPGAFCVSCAGNPAGSDTVDYMVIAGGGGGGGGAGPAHSAGAGGAGGYRESPGTASGCYTASPRGVSPAVALSVPATPYTITVGAGGAGSPCSSAGVSGSNSIFSTITSTGGGGGGSVAAPHEGLDGGSGGGGSSEGPTGKGSGDTPPAPVAQGTDGGDGLGGGGQYGGGGGGGALTAGGCAVACAAAGAGGNGATSSINATPTARAGGGGGGGSSAGRPAGAAGPGGGGAGGAAGCGAGGAGTVNTGSGAGGGGGGSGSGGDGGLGGSGVVIIRYKFQ